jgi:cell division protein FtsI/penicillin-binding protein 2
MGQRTHIVKTVQSGRLIVMVILLTMAFAGLGYRLVELQVLRREDLRKKAEDNTHRTFLREPRRGDIRDRRGNLLAGSVFVKTVCAAPELIGGYQVQVARTLAPFLEMDEALLIDKLRVRTYVTEKGETKVDPHVCLKHKVPLETWERIQAAMKSLSLGVNETALPPKQQAFYRNLRRSAITTEPYDDQMRVYPNRTLAAHILGYVGTLDRETVRGRVRDIAGADGVERILDSTLRGVPGWLTTEMKGKRELVAFREQDVEPHDGRHVVLTIDAGVQHIVETELAEVMQKHSPISASVIVVKPRTGEILALANAPTFDPNKPGAFADEFRRNRAITDIAEPGSTFKIVAISGALNEKMVTLDTQFDCEGGHFRYAGRQLRDDHPAGILSVENIVAKSSNIGTAKIALLLGPQRLYDYIRNFGFGGSTGIPLVGEVRGKVHPIKSWDKLSITRFPIGQGIAVTPLQMVMAMSAIANGGELMQPMLIDRVVDGEGNVVVQYEPQKVRQVVSENVAKQMVVALKSVVSTNGTARKAKLDHYTVAGKTGTAQKPGNGTYLLGKYFSSFIGFFPADNPELCISVVLDEPKLPTYYGSQNAAPAFRNIAERAAQYLAIKPDLIPVEPLMLTSTVSRPLAATKENSNPR